LRSRARPPHDLEVDEEPLIYRQEVTAMLFTLSDMNVNIARILQLLEEQIDGEEGLPEDDS